MNHLALARHVSGMTSDELAPVAAAVIERLGQIGGEGAVPISEAIDRDDPDIQRGLDLLADVANWDDL